MPRTSKRAKALQEIEAAMEQTTYAYTLASSSEEEDEAIEDIQKEMAM